MHAQWLSLWFVKHVRGTRNWDPSRIIHTLSFNQASLTSPLGPFPPTYEPWWGPPPSTLLISLTVHLWYLACTLPCPLSALWLCRISRLIHTVPGPCMTRRETTSSKSPKFIKQHADKILSSPSCRKVGTTRERRSDLWMLLSCPSQRKVTRGFFLFQNNCSVPHHMVGLNY
jgi:hypothetical protein